MQEVRRGILHRNRPVILYSDHRLPIPKPNIESASGINARSVIGAVQDAKTE